MKLAILSRKSSIYSTHRLKVAAEERGHEVHVIDYLRCYMNIASHRPQILFQGAPLEGYDAVIPRIGASKTFYGTAVVRQFEMMGVYSLNGSQALSRSRDKLRGLQLLARRGIGMPITGFAHSTKDIEGLIHIVGGPPLVVKILEGTRGLGVVLAETEQAATSVIEAFRGLDTNILVQELIRESVGTDIRCLVVGDRVKAAVLRRGNPNDLGPRLHRGTQIETLKLDPEERATAVRAAQAMGLRVAGVDLLRSARGPLVIGVAASPALGRVEGATGSNVAGAIVEFVEKDIKNRKTTGDRIKH